MMNGFDTHRIGVADESIHVAVGGAGAPLLLLHGYPQSHEMWAAVAGTLTSHYTVVALDLPGYGQSSAPAEGPERYAKRRLANDVLGVMTALGHTRFLVAAHDRGARVAYRLALDVPDSVAALSVLDIVPTADVWATFDADRAMRYYHWTFLAQPAPLPETLIGQDPDGYLDHTLASWTKAGDLSPFDEDALAAYRVAFRDPLRVAAMCMDYRAGATIDRAHDEDSRAAGARIGAPLQVIWGRHFSAGGGRSPLDIWRGWADTVEGGDVDAGHFVCEENPDAVRSLLLPFLARNAGRVTR